MASRFTVNSNSPQKFKAKHPEDINQPQKLKASQGSVDLACREAISVRRAKRGGAPKRALRMKAAKKVRRSHTPDGSEIQTCGRGQAENSSSVDTGSCPSSGVNSDTGYCIIVGERETPLVELETKSSHRDQQPLNSSPIAATPPPSEDSTKSSQVECSSSQRIFCEDYEARVEERGACQTGELLSRGVSIKLVESPPPHSAMNMPQNPHVGTNHLSGQGSDNIIDMSSGFRRLPIRALLNEDTSTEGNMQLTCTPNISSSTQPIPDTRVGKLWSIPSGLQSHTKNLTFGKPLSITLPVEAASHFQARRASEPPLARDSDVKLAPGPSSAKMPLEREIHQKLIRIGKVLVQKKDTPDSFAMLSINALLSETLLGFFRLYLQTTGDSEVSVLSFGVPDITRQRYQIMEITWADSDVFWALKRTIWYSFCRSMMMENPASEVFTVVVTAPLHMADLLVCHTQHLLAIPIPSGQDIS